MYNEAGQDDEVIRAFRIYAQLAANGEINKIDAADYFENDKIKALLERYAETVECIVLVDADKLYLVPVATTSPFHISNDSFKKKYLPAKAVNMDIYLMYMSIIVLLGCFYNSYQTNEPQQFVSMDYWLENMDMRMESLKRQEEEFLHSKEQELEINWGYIRDKWLSMDSVKEGVKNQDARTISRLGFLNQTRKFMIGQGLLADIGNFQMELTEKAKNIYYGYYMNSERNQDILNFMYSLEKKEKEVLQERREDNACYQQGEIH